MNWTPNAHIVLTCAHLAADVYLPLSAPKDPFIARWGYPHKDINAKAESTAEEAPAEFNGQELLLKHPKLFGFQSMLSDPINTALLKYFFARCYANQDTGELVIAYRGTDSLGNVPADLYIGGIQWSAYDEAAMAFYLYVLRNFHKSAKFSGPIWITGHSLGGYLAQIVATRFPGQTVAIVFDAPNVGGLVTPALKRSFFHQYDIIDHRYNNIFNVNSSAEDPVHHTGGYVVGQAYDFPTNPCPGGYLSLHPYDYGICEHRIQTLIAQAQKYKDTVEKDISQQANTVYQQELATIRQ